jgi:uncharacterized membrane protein
MDILFKTFLVLHIVTGTLGLISGTINIIGKKGGKIHQIVGQIFLYSMLAVSISAFVLSIIHPNYFLFIVGVFTLYLVSSGTRYLHLKQLYKGQKPKFIDWFLTYFMLVFGILFIAFGVYHIFHRQIFGIVFITFGGIGLKMVMADFKNYKGKSVIVNVWMTAHIQRMIGAYIAALTAFLVVNNQILPGYIAWLLPTLILFPVIVKHTKKYKVIRSK